MSAGVRVAAAALALVGTQFRLHGRDPATGLDCVGLAARALTVAGLEADPPRRYALRNSSIAAALDFARRCDLVAADGPMSPGDLILTAPGPAQHHVLGAVSGGGFVHAHAGLRRVALMPGPLAWPILRHWRPHPKG